MVEFTGSFNAKTADTTGSKKDEMKQGDLLFALST